MKNSRKINELNDSTEVNTVEKVYKMMKHVGIFNMVMGIILIVTGVGIGVSVLVNGARLITGKSKLTF